MPLPATLHVGAPLNRFVVFQTCWPDVRPNPFRQTYATFEFVGSIATRPIYRRGEIAPVTFVIVVAPEVVERNTRPTLVPTSRTSSLCGAMAIALMLAPTAPLTSVIVVPWLFER